MGREPPGSVLVVSHGHPEESPGGGEVHAYESFLALREAGWRAAFLFPSDAAVEPGHHRGRPDELSFPFASSGSRYRLWDDARSLGGGLDRWLADVVRTRAPDVVHVHHYYRVGRQVIGCLRAEAPDALLCLTLHDYNAICPTGYMVRQQSAPDPPGTLCTRSTVDRCRECCPERSRQELTARRDALRRLLDDVDVLVAPSAFLRDRYVDWGVDPGRIAVVDYGRAPSPRRPIGPPTPGQTRFGYLGRSIPEKGLAVLLAAIGMLPRAMRSRARFELHTEALARSVPANVRSAVEFRGPYAPAMAADRIAGVHWVVVPSVWWENSPLVIKEAFGQGRPVICSNVGGMAENVRDGVDGLHFPVGDPTGLARVLTRVVGDADLWRRLGARTAPPMTPREQAARLSLLYHRHRTV
jgi:glycosyltransferase involved in cell wall biosynthesis